MTATNAYTQARERLAAILAYWGKVSPSVVADDRPVNASNFRPKYNNSPPLTWADLPTPKEPN